ncbi:MAG: hypothetical protein ACKVQQ_10710, partial [Burkholderiales bacterium]
MPTPSHPMCPAAVVPQVRPLRLQATVSRRQCLLAVPAALLASGCTVGPGEDHDGPDAPATGPLPRRPRVAWVFSSGGPRGFVHVGVLKALH